MSLSEQEQSLRNHPEKKALADLLERGGAGELAITTNFKLCTDCHAFMKSASTLTQRRVSVQERKLLHVFEDGRCSCRDQWRWETRLCAS